MANDDPDLTQIKKEIDLLLREHRPDRYTVRGTDDEDVEEDERLDADWLDEVATKVEDRLPDEEVRKLYARKLVKQREGSATRSTNSFLRNIGETSQLPLGWWEIENDPVVVITRIVQRGKPVRTKEERVALRAMTPQDFAAFEEEERRRAARDHAARNKACDGAQFTREAMITSGARTFKVYASEELPPDAETVA